MKAHDQALAIDTLIDIAGSGENMHAQEVNPERTKNQLLFNSRICSVQESIKNSRGEKTIGGKVYRRKVPSSNADEPR